MNESSGNSAANVLDGEDSNGLNLREYGVVLIEKSWLILLCALVGLFGGFSYTKKLPITYRAETILQFGVESRNPLGLDPTNEPQATGQDIYQTVLASLLSRSFLSRVVEANALHNDARFLPANSSGRAATVEEAAGLLGSILSAESRAGTRMMAVVIEHSNPEIAQKVANAVATEYLQQGIEARAASSKIAVKFLVAEAEKQRKKLEQSEQLLQSYKEENNALSLDERQDTVNAKLKDLSSQWSESRNARLRLESDYAEVKAHAGNVEKLLSVESVANNLSVASAREEITRLEARISALDLRYTAKHPSMIQAQRLLDEAKENLRKAVLSIPEWMHSEYERALATEHSFEEEFKKQEKLVLELNRQAIPYNVLKRDVDTNQILYDNVLKRLKEADIASGIEANNVRIFESAALPTRPVSDKKLRIVIMAVTAGLAVGIVIALGLHLLDSSVKSVEQAERITGLPVVGAIPHRSRFDFSNAGAVLIDEPDSHMAEAFRSLRTALYLAGRKPGRKICLFTSALASEGKTFSSINYAVSLAQQGLATLLIDADLRAPMVGKIFAFNENALGLADYLAGEAALDRIVTETGIPNLFVIGAGQSPANPAELLANRAFGDLVVEMSARFDHLVVDTAPVVPVSDTLLLLEHAQTVCLVARAAKTPRALIVRAGQMLAQAGAKPVGLVLNHLSVGRGQQGYYSYGGYKKASNIVTNSVVAPKV